MPNQPLLNQVDIATASTYSRRTFLMRAALGAVAAAGATLAAGRILAGGKSQTSLPGQGSIFEPRRKDLQRYWQQKLGRFRLK